jgi:hypothetical protein
MSRASALQPKRSERAEVARGIDPWRCLLRSEADTQCMDYFRAYRECKKAWVGFFDIRGLLTFPADAQMEQMKKDKRKAWTG